MTDDQRVEEVILELLVDEEDREAREPDTDSLGQAEGDVAAFGGLELYGLTGALLAMLGVTLAAAAVDEIASRAAADHAGQPSAGALGSTPT